ncbi:MAG: proton-conducting transporter membrane subunit [Candidatus Competibacteraceae bacterium]
MFPLAAGLAAAQIDSTAAVNGGMLQAISHATAKAAMFMAAGLIYTTLGHDRIADLRGVARALPMTLVAFALGGASLIGLPPSGGFLAKWLLVSAAIDRPVVVGARDARGGPAHQRLRLHRRRARDGSPVRRMDPAGARSLLSAGGRAGAGLLLVSARQQTPSAVGHGARVG